METFEADMKRLRDLGFSEEYCTRIWTEYKTGTDPESIQRFVRAIVMVYDDRKEYVDAV